MVQNCRRQAIQILKISVDFPVVLASGNTRLKRFPLPTIRSMATSLSDQANKENWSHLKFLNELTMLECESRNANRMVRDLKKSELERGKRWNQVDWKRLSLTIRRRMAQMRSGEFLKGLNNLLLFERPGSGKTLFLNSLGGALVRTGHSVCMAPWVKLGQHLLLAKKELRLPQMLSKLGKLSALIIEDLGYVQQGREEMEVRYTLIADRDE